MTSRDFCYWLQGYFEIRGQSGGNATIQLSGEQCETIRTHLSMVFAHEIDPSAGGPEQQATLNHLHGQQDPTKPIMRC